MIPHATLPAQTMHGWWQWGGIAAMVVGALLLAIVVLVIVRVLLIPAVDATEPRTDATEPRTDETERAMAILRERFARGEIDEEEFERRSATLGRRDSSP